MVWRGGLHGLDVGQGDVAAVADVCLERVLLLTKRAAWRS